MKNTAKLKTLEINYIKSEERFINKPVSKLRRLITFLSKHTFRSVEVKNSNVGRYIVISDIYFNSTFISYLEGFVFSIHSEFHNEWSTSTVLLIII